MQKISVRLLSVLLALTLILSVAACGQTPEPDDNSTPVGDVSTTTTTTESDDTTTTEGEDTTTEDVSADDTTVDVSTDDATITKKPTTIKKPSTSTGGKNSTGKPTSTTVTTKKPSTTAATTSSKVLTTTTTTKPGTTSTTSTTRSTKRTVTGKTTTTTTTTAPTTTTKDPNIKSIKVLSVGHSFSADAMRAYMWDIFKSAGYDEVILGYLYIPGCSLETHWTNIQGNQSKHQYSKNEAGRWIDKYNQTAKSALLDEDWDYVTFQPSPDYGGGPECCGSNNNDYKNFNNLVNWALDNATNSYVEIHYHLTWSFATDCRLWSFMYHDYDQMTQYNDFIAATKKYVLTNRNVKGVIPCNTSIQNARSSHLGDTFNMPGENDPNKDGYHLNDQGDYVAALTWFAYFSGEKASSVTFIPDQYKDAFPAIAEAVDNAIKNPFNVTESSYK